MKTKMKLLAMIALAAFLGACSSGMQMSRSEKQHGDDLYYNPSASQKIESTDNSASQANSKLDIAELEKRYSEILANDTLETVDSLVYKAEAENKYESLLSTSYQDSYERRLRGMQDPWYGVGGTAHYHSDFWYTQAYDPYFYNVIVMGNTFWVEPYYISAMFSWPRRSWGFYSYGYNPYSYLSFGYGWNYGFGYPYYYGWGNPYYYNFGYYGWSPWSNYAWGYNAGFWSGYNYYAHGGGYSQYGPRPTGGSATYGGRPGADGAGVANINHRQRELSKKQVTFKNDPERTAGITLGAESPEFSTQDPQVRPESTRIVREPVREQTTRTTREGLNVNPTRIRPTNERGSTGSVREHNPTYTRPNRGNSNEFNRPTRNYPSTEATRPNERRGENVSTPSRTTPRQQGRTYSPPPRVSSPASSPSRSNRGSSSTGTVSRPSSSSSGSSSAPARTSSGSSSSSSKSSSSSGNSRKR